MKTIKYIIAGIIGLLSMNIQAQQEAQFTQYMDNMLYYNPAYAGSRDMMNITALHRQQWAGFKGAPISTSFSLHSPLRYDNVGLGLSIMNDNIGPLNVTWIHADFSYSLKFKKNNSRLSFGLKGGVNLVNGDLSQLVKETENDHNLNVRYGNDIQPNFGAGIYYHSDHWFVGLAAPKILENFKSADYSSIEKVDQRHYYFSLGGYIKLSRLLKLRPSTMLKITPNAPLALDLSAAFIFYDRVWLGANYRLTESAGVLLQYQISNQFKIGYSFDMSTNKLRARTAGTHEVLLSYDLLFKSKSLTSPRYF